MTSYIMYDTLKPPVFWKNCEEGPLTSFLGMEWGGVVVVGGWGVVARMALIRLCLKGRVQCFFMQVVMSNCFLLNPEQPQQQKICHKSILSFSRKTQELHTLIPKNEITEPKNRRLGYSNNQLKSC